MEKPNYQEQIMLALGFNDESVITSPLEADGGKSVFRFFDGEAHYKASIQVEEDFFLCAQCDEMLPGNHKGIAVGEDVACSDDCAESLKNSFCQEDAETDD